MEGEKHDQWDQTQCRQAHLHGVRAGAAGAGVDSVGVTYGYGSREEFMEHNATYIVDSPKDILNIVLK